MYDHVDEDSATVNIDEMEVVESIDPTDGVLGVGIIKPPRNTSKHALPSSCVLQKSSIGRSQLFLSGVNYSDVRCSSSITQHVQRNSLFHPHRQNGRLPEAFSKPCDIACWHCCHSFETPPIPVPKDYDAAEGMYHVFGCFCSLMCAKAYLLETPTFNTGLSIMLLSKMGREVYSVDEIQTAPPRLSLDMFGGPYTIDAFRSNKTDVSIHVPPFVSTYMVCEERSEMYDTVALGVDSEASVRGLRRPNVVSVNRSSEDTSAHCSQRSYFNKFVSAQDGESTPPIQTSKREPTRASSTLSAFMKPQ